MFHRLRFLVLTIVLASVGQLTCHAQSVFYFPIVRTSGYSTGLAFSNPTDTPATVTLTPFGVGGETVTVVVPEARQVADFATEFFPDANGEGWVRVESDVAGVTGFYLIGDYNRVLDGGPAATSGTRLVLPYAVTRGDVRSRLTLINPADEEVFLDLSLYSSDGTLLATRPRNMFPQSHITAEIQTLLGYWEDVEGYVIVEASTPVVGAVTILDPYAYADNIILTAVPDSGATSIHFPHTATGGGYVTAVAVRNTTGVPVETTLEYRRDGNPSEVRTTRLQLRPFEQRMATIRDLFGITEAALQTGWVRATAPTPALDGFQNFVFPETGGSAVLPAAREPSTRLINLQVAEQSGAEARAKDIFTGLAVLNPSDQSAEVAVSIVNDEGRTLGINTLRLAPLEKTSLLLRQIAVEALGELSGTVWISSDVPVHALQLFGSRDLSFLSQIPAVSLDDVANPATPLPRRCSVTGHVAPPETYSAGGILVEAEGPERRQTRTDHDGLFVLKDLPCGSYSIAPVIGGQRFNVEDMALNGPTTGLSFEAVPVPVEIADDLNSAPQLSVSTLARGLVAPTGIWGDTTSLHVTDRLDHTLNRIDRATGARTIVAGQSGVAGSTDGPGTSATLTAPGAIWGDGTNVYVADRSLLRRVHLSTGDVTTVARGVFSGIWGMDAILYATEYDSHRIARIDPSTGDVTTFADSSFFEGVIDGTGPAARFYTPQAIWGDGTYLYVSHNDLAIRRIEIATAEVTTIGDGLGFHRLGPGAFRRLGLFGVGDELYIAEPWLAMIRRQNLSSGTLVPVAGTEHSPIILRRRPASAGFVDGVGPRVRFDEPAGLWTDGHTLYIADSANGSVRRAQGAANTPVLDTLAPNHGDLSTTFTMAVKGRNFMPGETAVDIAGDQINVGGVQTLDDSNLTATLEISPDATPGARSVRVVTPFGQSYTQTFTVHQPTLIASSVTEGHAGLTYEVTLTGTGFIAHHTEVHLLGLMTIRDPVVEDSSRLRFTVPLPASAAPGVRQIEVTTSVGRSNRLDFSVLEPAPGDPTQLRVDYWAGRPRESGGTDGPGPSSRFNSPTAAWGNTTHLFVTDTASHTIRSIDRATAAVSTLAGLSSSAGFADGIGGEARFREPRGIWGDGRHLYVADRGNRAVRRIDPASGNVSTLTGPASGILAPTGVWGADGQLYVTDAEAGSVVRIDLSSGAVETLAGGLTSPAGLWGDGSRLYVADSGDHTILSVLRSTGAVTVLAGAGGATGHADGEPGVARFDSPMDAWGSSGVLLIADAGNDAIRRVDLATGHVLTLAGAPGHTASSAPGTGPEARIMRPTAVWASEPDVYVVESGAHQIRLARHSVLAPELQSVRPAFLASGTAATLVLSGRNFVGDIVIQAPYDLNLGTPTVIDSETIRVTAALEPDRAGRYNVTVDTPYGSTYSMPIVVDLPTLTSVSPSSALQGYTVEFTLRGTNFTRSTRIRLSGNGVRMSQPLTVVDASTVRVRLAIDADAPPGPKSIQIETAGGTTAALTFEVQRPPGPTLAAMTPTGAVQGSTLQVRLTGTNFIDGQTGIAVDAGDIRVDFVSVIDHEAAEATFVVDSTAPPGIRHVRVTTPSGLSEPADFRVEAPNQSALAASPTVLAQGSTINVTIAGAGFSSGTVAVDLDGTDVEVTHVTVVNAGMLIATVRTDPDAATGSRMLHVATPTTGTRSLPIEVRRPTIGESATLAVSSLSTTAELRPTAIWGDGDTLYVYDRGIVKKVVPATGTVVPLAGRMFANVAEDGVGSEAAFASVWAIWGDGVSLYMTDAGAIRRLDLETHAVTTLAGIATVFGSVDGVGTAARFSFPRGIWGDGQYLYVADSGGRLRRIDPDTREVTTPLELPPLTNGHQSRPSGIWGNGEHLFVIDEGYLVVHSIDIATAQVTTLAGRLGLPATGDGTGTDAAFTYPRWVWGAGTHLFVSDLSTLRRARIADGQVTTVAGRPQTLCCRDGIGSDARLEAGSIWSDGFRLYWADRDRIRYAEPVTP